MRMRNLGSGNLSDPGSGVEKIRTRDKHPGSATLQFTFWDQIWSSSIGGEGELRIRGVQQRGGSSPRGPAPRAQRIFPTHVSGKFIFVSHFYRSNCSRGQLARSEILYVPETHIMYFIRRCWFLKCSEEVLLGGGGGGCYWYIMKYCTLFTYRWWLGRSTGTVAGEPSQHLISSFKYLDPHFHS